MYELLVLSFLMYRPLHGYLIAKMSNDILGPWEKVSRGTLYPLLTKLERAGLITALQVDEATSDTDRQSNVFSITSLGQKRFFQLMLDSTSSSGSYRKLFHIKTLHLDLLSLEDQLYLVDHYLSYCQTSIRYQQAQAQNLAQDSVKRNYMGGPMLPQAVTNLMELLIEQWQTELVWTQSIRQRIIAQMQQQEEFKERRNEN